MFLGALKRLAETKQILERKYKYPDSSTNIPFSRTIVKSKVFRIHHLGESTVLNIAFSP